MKIPLFGRKQMDSARDPVCHMDVDINDPMGGTWRHDSETYYFCGPGCNKAFQKEPNAYLSGDKKIDM